MRSLRTISTWLTSAALGSCALPSYDKVSEGVYSCPAFDPPGERSSACLECVRVSCCDSASACAADQDCSAALFENAITPFTVLDGAFDNSLGCIQRACDEECNVSFGCEDTDYVPQIDANAQGDYPFTLSLHPFSTLTSPGPLRGIAAKPCSGITLTCDSDLTDAPLTDRDGEVMLEGDSDLGQTIELRDPEYDPTDALDLTRYPPHLLNWSAPLHESGAVDDFLFSSRDVKSLVELAALQTFSRDDSHIVFYMHNCLPFRFLGEVWPHAGIDGASLVLKSRKGELADPVFRDGPAFAPLGTPTSAVEGSGGAAVVSPGAWTAKASVQIGSQAHELNATFEVPAGGVGVVRMFPKSAR